MKITYRAENGQEIIVEVPWAEGSDIIPPPTISFVKVVSPQETEKRSFYYVAPKVKAPKEKPPCKGFHWLGQDMSGCENCGRDISEHEGLAWTRGGSPFERGEEIIIPFDEARRRVPLFAYYVTPIGVPDDYAGPYRYDKGEGWTYE